MMIATSIIKFRLVPFIISLFNIYGFRFCKGIKEKDCLIVVPCFLNNQSFGSKLKKAKDEGLSGVLKLNQKKMWIFISNN